MKIERIYVAGCRRDVHFTRCCVASIRYWYPKIPITLMKDYSQGPYDTAELENLWKVELFDTDRKLLGVAGKLEPMFRRGAERCLIIDSDIVFVGKLLDALEPYNEDFIVAHTPNPPDEIPLYYFDLAKLAEFDPDFVFPQYTFNAGQIVATAGILTREDFAGLIRFDEPPVGIQPEIFCTEQGPLNYVLMKKAQEGKVSVRRHPFMWWGWVEEQIVDIRRLNQRSPYRFLVHWAGPKGNHTFDTIRNGHILRHFKSYYDARVAASNRRDRTTAILRRFGLFSRT